jgi:cytochrome c biogenesis protein ResB
MIVLTEQRQQGVIMTKSLALSIKTLTLLGVGVILALCVQGHQTPITDMENHNTPAVVKADAKVMAKAEAGRTCSAKPVLTDTIVVIDKAGKTRIMKFDATYAAAKAGTVKVITYCK